MRKVGCSTLTAFIVFLVVGCCSDRPGDRMIYEPWHYYSAEETACALKRALCCCGAQMTPSQVGEQVAKSRQPSKQQVVRATVKQPPTKVPAGPARVTAHASNKARSKAAASADVRPCSRDEPTEAVAQRDAESRRKPIQIKPSRDVRPQPTPATKSSQAANDLANDVQLDAWHPPAKITPEPN
jgi:hypothetical protein